jgi:hypothetical protein
MSNDGNSFECATIASAASTVLAPAQPAKPWY